LIELLVGYPERLSRAIGHPVTWMGRLISFLENRFNRGADAEARRRWGAVALLVLLVVVGFVSFFIEVALLLLPFGLIALALVASTLLAQRSLFVHVAGVADALEQGGLPAGREAVAHIVGRDTADLDQAGVARAAIESLAENFSDGVVAPCLYGALLGLPGMALYKAVNTADSMIGHLTPRHAAFGWAAAKLDDLINLPAARLAALWLVLAALLIGEADAKAALAAVRRDARRHRSPNAGWPEAAMAGALHLRLAGPRTYHGVVTKDVWMGDGRSDAGADDIRRALRLYKTACAIEFAALGLLALLIWLA
jgi:adenosylcobinamide-phosphate synthase